MPNPINPESEDFADKWSSPDYVDLHLEENFWKWLKQAQNDFEVIGTTRDKLLLEKTAASAFGFTMPERTAELEKLEALLKKRDILASGNARTNKAGVIGTTGVANAAHGFYGDE